MGLFVKFCRYNERTLENLILNKIRFSTVYDFNDFNELHYIGTNNNINLNCIQSYLAGISVENFSSLINKAKESGRYDKKWIEENFYSTINSLQVQNLLTPDNGRFLEEIIAYANVGIFCCSGKTVFDDDAAQLMFAHYGDNNKGLALIYEIPDLNIKPVTYKKERPGSSGRVNRIQDWIGGNYTTIDDFLKKSIYWQYEKEHRLFGTPGNIQLSALNACLKGIFYTSKFSNPSSLETLKKIKDTIFLEEIYAAHGDYHFRVLNKNKSEKVSDWLKRIESS